MVITSPIITDEIPLKLWTREEYYRLEEMDILTSDEPVELINGQIIKKHRPQSTLHAFSIRRLLQILKNTLGNRVLVTSQIPITLNNYSEPKPDIAVVKVDSRDYFDHHPYSEDIYLIVEIADKTLNKDCNLKAQIYAEAGISDYWVLDINNRQLYVFRQPTNQGYRSRQILLEDEEISLLNFPDVRILIKELLPPNE